MSIHGAMPGAKIDVQTNTCVPSTGDGATVFILPYVALPLPIVSPMIIYARLSASSGRLNASAHANSAWKMSEAKPERRRFRQDPIALFESIGVVNLSLECLIEGAVEFYLPGVSVDRAIAFVSSASVSARSRQRRWQPGSSWIWS